MTRVFSGFLIVTVAAGGCGGGAPAQAIAPHWNTPAFNAGMAHAPVFDVESLSSERRSLAMAVVEDAADVVSSEAFRVALNNLEPVATGNGNNKIAGSQILAIFADTSTFKPLPVRYFEGGLNCKSSRHETADTGLDLETGAGTELDPRGIAAVCIQKPVFARAQDSSDFAEVGCDINTIVHEWMHAVPDQRDKYLFVDAGHKGSPDPLVSYTVGALAQCVFLFQTLKHSASPTESFLTNCVTKVGTTVFKEESCDHDWVVKNLAP